MNKINDHKLSNLYFSLNIVKHSLKSPGKILFARKAKAAYGKIQLLGKKPTILLQMTFKRQQA
jgi:hypothetical protein